MPGRGWRRDGELLQEEKGCFQVRFDEIEVPRCAVRTVALDAIIMPLTEGAWQVNKMFMGAFNPRPVIGSNAAPPIDTSSGLPRWGGRMTLACHQHRQTGSFCFCLDIPSDAMPHLLIALNHASGQLRGDDQKNTLEGRLGGGAAYQ
jgi:hypothetical protein